MDLFPFLVFAFIVTGVIKCSAEHIVDYREEASGEIAICVKISSTKKQYSDCLKEPR